MVDLLEKEERLRFLLSKIDSELSKFKDIKSELETKKQELTKELEKLHASDANISFYSEDQENVFEFVNSHNLELENLKNYIAGELQKVVKQREILELMKKKYGDNIIVEETQFGGIKIKYTDDEISEAAQTTTLSKKLVQNLKDTTLNKKSQ